MYQKLLIEIEWQVVLRDWLRADLQQGLDQSGFPWFPLRLVLGAFKFCFLS